ncbi:hypothetical protein G9P44_004175 [Scheffersomyces stipitis]|nr:hypothetical protein G9P44_004175 [Scheffersomyces stipitis]
MSTLDINRVVSSLQSSKIKDRNDALTLLEDMTSAKFRLNSKQFRILIRGIFDLIKKEAKIYYNNKLAPVSLRLSRASSAVRIICERAINDMSLQLKFRGYYDLVEGIIANFAADNQQLEPCSYDFLRILSTVISKNYFKEHLNRDEWKSIFNFVTHLIADILSDMQGIQGISNHGKLLQESFSALANLLQCDTHMSISYMHLLDHTIYFRLSSLLEKAAKTLKESVLAITIFKIINKLIIVLATEDFRFVNRLIRLGTNIMSRFYSTQLDKLMNEFLVFLNLSATHNYIDLSKLPKLTDDNGTMISEQPHQPEESDEDEDDISIRSFVSETRDEPKRLLPFSGKVSADSNEYLVHSIGNLIISLISRLSMSDFHLDVGCIGILHTETLRRDWFNLNSIYLKSQDHKPWLLCLGLTKLLHSYFCLKQTVAKTSNMLVLSTILQQQPKKRQKWDTVGIALSNSRNLLEFCNTLIGERQDIREQQVGLQILTFYLEAFDLDNEFESEDADSSETPDGTFQSIDKSINDTTFDFTLGESNDNGSFRASIIMKNILYLFKYSELSFWPLLASNGLIKIKSLNWHSRHHHYSQLLLNIALPLVKNEELFKYSCNLIFTLVCNSNDLTKKLDESLTSQIDSIIDMVEIVGPFSISTESFLFWYSIAKIVRANNSAKKFILGERIQDWLLLKWSHFFDVKRNDLQSECQGLAEFIMWISGESVSVRESKYLPDSYNGSLYEACSFSNYSEDLNEFIALKKPPISPSLSFVIDGISRNNNIEQLMSRILGTVHGFSTSTLLFEWYFVSQGIYSPLRGMPRFDSVASLFEEQSCEILKTIAVRRMTIEELTHFLSLYNQIDLDHIFSNRSGYLRSEMKKKFAIVFPFDRLLKTFSEQIVSQFGEEVVVQESRSVFDEEFSDVNRSSPVPSLGSSAQEYCGFQLDYEKVPCIEVLKFIFVTHKYIEKDVGVTFTVVCTYFDDLPPNQLVYAFHALVKEFETNSFDILSVPLDLLGRLVRIFGEKILVDQNYERSELTLTTISQFLKIVLPIVIKATDENFKKDYYDMCMWLIQCGTKDLILTEVAMTSFCEFIIRFVDLNDETFMTTNQLTSIFLSKFSNCSNSNKIDLVPHLVRLLKSSTSLSQANLYSELFMNFSTPEESIETCATYAMFFSSLTLSSSQVMLSSLFNLLECSRFKFFVPYLEHGLKMICEFIGIEKPRVLFKAYKLELLLCWWKFDSLHQFPYFLFGYPDQEKFYLENHKELVSITISTKQDQERSYESLWLTLSKLRNTDVATLVSESLPLIISIAYTREGIRNAVFNVVLSYLKDSFKQEFIDKHILIVSEIISHTDLTREDLLIDKYNSNKVASTLISKNSKVLNFPGVIMVPLNSSLELMQKISEKYGSKKDSFWEPRQIYFIFRRVSLLLLHQSLSNEQKIVVIRKLKLICILGSEHIHNVQIMSLIVDTLNPFVCVPDLFPEICRFYLLLKVDNFHTYGDNSTLLIVIRMVAVMLNSQNLPLVDRELSSQLMSYARRIGEKRTIRPILMAAIGQLKRDAASFKNTLSTLTVETYLNDTKEMSIFTDATFKYILILISLTFETIDEYNDSGKLQNVAKILMQCNSGQFALQTNKFNIWSAKYLSSYYLHGGWNKSGYAFPSNEYRGIPSAAFQSEVNSLNPLVKEVIAHSLSDDFEVAACAESILGVLMYKYERSKSEISKFLDFDDIYRQLEGHITPLDFHACILLNDEYELDFLGDTLSYVINNLDSLISTSSFGIWSTRLFLAINQELASSTSIAPLISTFAAKVNSFSAKQLPNLICFYLLTKGKVAIKNIRMLLSQFSSIRTKDTMCISFFLDVVLYLRMGAQMGLGQFVDVTRDLDVVSFSEMAASINRYKTSMMLLEACFYEDPKRSILVSNTLTRKVYESIDDEDLIFGLKEEPSLDFVLSMVNRNSSSMEQLAFSSAIFDSSIALSFGSRPTNILQSMNSSGMLGVSRILSNSTGLFQLQDQVYDWGWKLNSWDIPIPKDAITEQEIVYKVLKQVHDYPYRSLEVCQETLVDVLLKKDRLINDSLSSKDYRLNTMVWMKSLATISSIESLFTKDVKDLNEIVFGFDKETDWFEKSDSSLSESIILARRIAFQILADYPVEARNISQENAWLGVLNYLVRYNKLTSSSKEVQKMINAMICADSVAKTKLQEVKGIKELVEFVSACTLWSNGQTSIPVAMISTESMNKGIDSPLTNYNHSETYLKALTVRWLSESRQAAPDFIMEEYVRPISEKALELSDGSEQRKIFQMLAKYCENQYKSRNLNEEISKLEKQVMEKKVEIEELKAHYGRTSVPAEEKKSVQRFYSKLKNQLSSEVSDLERAKRSREDFSERAIQYYLESIGWDNQEPLDKFLALWLELSFKDELNDKLRLQILGIPSYLLVNLSTQLISRLANENTEFQRTLSEIVHKICTAHPYHTLYQLFSLMNEKLTSDSKDAIMGSKRAAARKIWNRLLSADTIFVSQTLKPIESFCLEASILSAHKVSRGKSLHLEKLDIGNYWLHGLSRIPPPTKDLAVDQNSNYRDVPVLAKIDEKVSIAASGLSLPKIATFTLSDGTTHRMLLKHGTDDLRQDSIMEQVFEKVNQIFIKDKDAAKRNLTIRTYKAVPLGPTAGIIEFVANSIALIDIIKPYHLKYDKMKLEKARELMKECQSGEKLERQRVFRHITDKIKPVLHHFFMDTFLTPDVWFDSRIAYTRGIATTSIVGHILGLGDRHCNNILLDKSTGEPIHIDLGVAFDQGTRLPIPETVPFRLTRDIVDGFGSTGVEGVFKRSCEHTFRVLQENKENILSILEVLRWDPLYSWSISPIRKKKLQEEGGGVTSVKLQEDGSEAGRAVLGVANKLAVGGLSVEATVRELVQEASSPDNLALIYFGWCPFY